MNTDEIVAGVKDLFPGADRQALRCLAELMDKRDRQLHAAALDVYDTFARDLAQGYRTKDKEYAVAVLGQALDKPVRVEPAPSAEERR